MKDFDMIVQQPQVPMSTVPTVTREPFEKVSHVLGKGSRVTVGTVDIGT